MIRGDSAPGFLHTFVEWQAGRNPGLVAVRAGTAQLSYGELNGRANQLARLLRRHGAGQETVVGICLDRCAETVVSMLAVLKAGAAFLLLDPAQPAPRLAALLRDAGVRVLLTQAEFAGRRAVPARTVLPVQTSIAACADFDTGDLPPAAGRDSAAYVTYTSGSTGGAKGVLGLHGGMADYIAWLAQEFPAAPGEVAAHRAPLTFLDAVWEIFLPLSMGSTLVIVPERVARDPASLTEFLAAHSVSRLVVVPSLLRALVEWASAGNALAGLAGIKLWFCSGEELTTVLARSFRRSLPRARLVNVYGMSEASAASTWHDIPGFADDAPAHARLPIGKPIPGTYVRIVAAAPVPGAAAPGEVGEICIGGAGLARGYLGQPGRTAERFVPDPLADEPGSRVYRSGDLGRVRPDGLIEYHGRGDQQVKIRGARVELGEVEAALAAHPAVRAAAAAVSFAPGGEARLAAYYVGDGAAPRPAELRAFLSGRLPGHMLPSTLSVLPRLPLTASGKLDRSALPGPAVDRSSLSARYRAPRTPQEWLVADVWADVLGVTEVGRQDDFVELGGDSLTAMRVTTELLRLTGVRIFTRALFEAGTVADLAPSLGQAHPAAAP